MPKEFGELNWGVIFLVNLAPFEKLKGENRIYEKEKKIQEFEKLRKEISGFPEYSRVKVATIENRFNELNNYCEVTVKAIMKSDNDQKNSEIELVKTDKINIGNPDELSPLFKKICESFKSDKYILFTWDHGFGSGMFSDRIGISTRTLLPNFPAMYSKSILTRNIGGSLIGRNYPLSIGSSKVFEYSGLSEREMRDNLTVSVAGEYPDVLTNNELAFAIKTGFPTGSVEILVMMNCAMQLIDTSYAYKECVNFLVAAQTVMWWFGYQYREIIEKLMNPGEMNSSLDLSVFIMRSERRKMSTESLDKYFHSSLSVINCKQSDALCNKFGELLSEISSNFKIDRIYSIYFTRSLLRNLSCISQEVISYYEDYKKVVLEDDQAPDYNYIDFFSFISFLRKHFLDTSNVYKIASEIMNLKADFVIETSTSPNIYQQNIPIEVSQFVASGVSLFFPKSLVTMSASNNIRFIKDNFYRVGSRLRTHFDTKSGWSIFLNNYHNKIANLI
jgi:hypothetical protein